MQLDSSDQGEKMAAILKSKRRETKLTRMDFFSRPYPQFNNKGQARVTTFCGFTFSLFLITSIILFGTQSFRRFIQRENPNIMELVRGNFIGIDEKFPMNGRARQIAFAFQDIRSGESLFDDRYVRFEAAWLSLSPDQQEEQSIVVPMERCSQANRDRFYTPSAKYASRIEKLLKRDELLCLGDDLLKKQSLSGDFWGDTYSYLSVRLVPCQANLSPEAVPPTCIQDEQKQKEFLRAPQVLIVVNNERIDIEDFSKGPIVQESIVESKQFSPVDPNWIDYSLEKYLVSDRIDWLQYGQETTHEFYRYRLQDHHASSWRDYPDNYKFTSVEISINSDLHVIERQTYSVLEFMGDMGGLFDALFAIGSWLIYPIVTFQMKRNMLHQLYMFKPKNEKPSVPVDELGALRESSQEQRDIFPITDFIHKVRAFESVSYYGMCLRQDPRRARYERLVKLGDLKYNKEMDLFKFIKRMRFLNFAVLSLLSAPQRKFLDKLSQPVIRESTDSETASEEESRLSWAKDNMEYVGRLQKRNDAVSRRLFQLFRIKINQQGTIIPKKEKAKAIKLAYLKRRASMVSPVPSAVSMELGQASLGRVNGGRNYTKYAGQSYTNTSIRIGSVPEEFSDRLSPNLSRISELEDMSQVEGGRDAKKQRSIVKSITRINYPTRIRITEYE